MDLLKGIHHFITPLKTFYIYIAFVKIHNNRLIKHTKLAQNNLAY